MSLNRHDFLLARLGEDEELALSAQGAQPGCWRARPDTSTKVLIEVDQGVRPLRPIATASRANQERAEHIARWDPVRVLAECEAKRRAIEAAWCAHVDIEGEWGMGKSRDELLAEDDVPPVVAALASIYADHPDYRDEWR